jgi:hypothetical protein
MVWEIRVTHTNATAFAHLPSLRRKSELSERPSGMAHYQDLQSPKVVFYVQPQVFPIIPKLIELNEMQEILWRQSVFWILDTGECTPQLSYARPSVPLRTIDQNRP